MSILHVVGVCVCVQCHFPTTAVLLVLLALTAQSVWLTTSRQAMNVSPVCVTVQAAVTYSVIAMVSVHARCVHCTVYKFT